MVDKFNTRNTDNNISEKVKDKWKRFVGEVLTFKRRRVKKLWTFIRVTIIAANTYRTVS